MKTRHLLPLLGLALLMAGPVLAQGPEDAHHPRKEQFRAELGLSDAQAAQMDAIHEKYRPQMKALRDKAHDDPKAQEELRRLHEAQRAEVAKVLTPEQLAKADALRRAHHGHGPHGHGPHQSEEARRYHRQHVEPVLKAQRLKLEPQISAADKASIQALRARRDQLHDARKQEDPAAHAQHHAERKAIMEEAQAIADRYRSQIEVLHREIQPQMEQWHKDLEQMRPKDAPEGHHGKHGHPKHGPGPDGVPPHAYARFVLMDPFATPDAQAKAAPDPDATLMRVFPNPVVSRATLRFTLPQPGNATIDVVAQDGRVLRTLSQGHRAAGEHFVDLDTQELPAGAYLFRLSTDQGVRVRAFSVVK